MLLALPFTDLSNATIYIRSPGVFICYYLESHKQTQQNFTCMLRCIRAFVVIETNNASLCCQKQTTLLESLLKRISILTIQSISVQSKSSWHFQKQERVSQAYEMSVSKKRVHTKRTTFHFFVRNGERFPLLLETNNAFRIVTQTYFNSEHTIDFCVVKVFMVLLETKKKFLKLTKRP